MSTESARMNDANGIADFEGRVAFVTGGARGIGRGIVRALLRRGVNVAIADISAAALDEVRAKFGEPQDRVRTYRLDVSDRDAYAEVGAAVAGDLGEVTLLFNNAGVIDSVSPSRLNYRMWDHVMGINLTGVYNGIQTFVPAMLASSRRCHVVNTASEAGLLEAGSGFLYHASKYAVVGMSESLRRELAHSGVGVSVLLPGPVATDIVQNARHLRPDAAPVHSARVIEILDTAHHMLKESGTRPDGVGELVLDAVEHDRPYVATRNELSDLLDARNAELRAAMEHAEALLAAS
ncbi:SDR family NAD(P)-dependent oxidoreductase [Nonomuraea mesophila]|uniref:SDR family NAD(P)-dependent oxidoreductase n=1 Tax=Nonomuraea mesophila TaxID=2530382 RepID=A0A4R5FAC2_9ACTN|nr:SDR family NAD(P)-dependent oxidoreductase [Nonomuraea mesophila]TDE45159.1 SDR family NAD(P)-dependent oxidoreductase [Nonomuraea mesophila]